MKQLLLDALLAGLLLAVCVGWSAFESAPRDRVLQFRTAADNRALHRVAPPVPLDALQSAAVQRDIARVAAALRQFRAAHGFGRAIAAPQLGIARRLVAVAPAAVGGGGSDNQDQEREGKQGQEQELEQTRVLVNPRVVARQRRDADAVGRLLFARRRAAAGACRAAHVDRRRV